MKKLLLFSSALAIVMLASCNKEQKEEPVNQGTPSNELSEPQDGSYFSFPATREVATKSYLDGQDFKWEDGEAIAVVSANGNITKFTYNETADVFTSDSFDSSTSGPFYVVSPFSESISIVDGKVITVFPADQRPGVHGVDPSALLSVGKTADVETLSNGVELKNAFSLVQVQISDTDVTSISFEGNYQGTEVSPSLAGPVTVDPANGTATVTGRVTSVSLAPKSGNLAAGTYTLAVLPQNLPAGMKVVFKREGEVQAHYRSSSTARSLERNAGISLSSSAINVSGLKARCYYILNETDLQAWNSQTPAKSDKAFLGADIDMSGQSWSQRTGFVGSFDGQNHFIYNFVYETSQYCGFIRTTLKDGFSDIRNFSFGTKDGMNWDGVSKLTHSNSSDRYTWYYVGVIGKTQGADVLVNVKNYAKIEVAAGSNGRTRIGGICGNWASTEKMQDCINYGAVENNASETGLDKDKNGNDVVSTSNVGGIVGQCDAASTIEGCKNYGTVNNHNPYVKWIGGILGNTSYAVKINKCYNYGEVHNYTTAYTSWLGTGGIVGWLNNTSAIVSECTVDGAVLSTVCHVVGGIAAQITGSMIENCIVKNTSITTSTSFAAGILSYGPNGGRINNCIVTGGTTISGVQEVGGIGGRLKNVDISNCKIEEVTITGTGKDVGGVIGWTEGTEINNCFIKSCKITGLHNVGGIIGYAYINAAANYNIYNCGIDASTLLRATSSDSGNTSGDCEIAGICGWMRCASTSSFKIVNCYCHASIKCDLAMSNVSAGGVIGYCSLGSGTGEIHNFATSLTASSITVGGVPVASPSARFGAIYGMLPNKPIQVTNSYYMSDKGLGIGDTPASVVLSDNEAISESVFKDGTTVPAKLNAFVSSYSDYELKSWTHNADGLPILSE